MTHRAAYVIVRDAVGRLYHVGVLELAVHLRDYAARTEPVGAHVFAHRALDTHTHTHTHTRHTILYYYVQTGRPPVPISSELKLKTNS